MFGAELETTQLCVFAFFWPFGHSCHSVPVFFGCICGKDHLHLPSPTALGSCSNLRRISSVGAAIEFAKANNLLGIFVDADLLVLQLPCRLCMSRQ